MPETRILATTQEHIDIEDIRDDLLIFKNGNVALVLQTNAVNFDLLSEAEQDAMIFAYSQMLNSLSFPIQILIRSKLMDISFYLKKLRDARLSQSNHALVAQMELYENFIKELIAKNNVLDKRFYVIIPYTELSFSSLNPFGGAKKPTFDKWVILERAKTSLQPKREHLLKQLNRIGIKSKRLTTQELVELFYDIYNPTVAREQKVALTTSDYTTPLVEPAIETTFVNKPAATTANTDLSGTIKLTAENTTATSEQNQAQPGQNPTKLDSGGNNGSI